VAIPAFAKVGFGCVAALILLVIVGFCALLAYVKWQQRAYRNTPDTHDLVKRIDQMGARYLASHPYASLVIAVSQDGKRYVKGFGEVAPNERTIYEIGSVTKVFTGLLLARMVESGLARLDDPIDLYLPDGMKAPSQNGRLITLQDLATHTAGLPRLPANLLSTAKDLQNPYAGYGTAELLASVPAAKLESEPGKKSTYSNYGYGLLGQLLARKAGRLYEDLVTEKIIAPLNLSDTVFHLSAGQQARLALPHDTKGTVIKNWDMEAMAPAGALRSDAADLLAFLEANLAPDALPLGAALKLAQKIHFRGFADRVGLGWQIRLPVEQQVLFWHNGGTGGYVSFIGFEKKSRMAVVILSNSGDATAGDASVDKMAFELLKAGSKISLK